MDSEKSRPISSASARVILCEVDAVDGWFRSNPSIGHTGSLPTFGIRRRGQRGTAHDRAVRSLRSSEVFGICWSASAVYGIAARHIFNLGVDLGCSRNDGDPQQAAFSDHQPQFPFEGIHWSATMRRFPATRAAVQLLFGPSSDQFNSSRIYQEDLSRS